MKKIKIRPSLIKHFSKMGSMRSIIAIMLFGISLGVAFEEMVGIGTWHNFQPQTDKISVCFTPPSGCGSLIAIEVSKAQKSLYVQAYGLTLPSVIHQLKEARKRGVEVHILLDGGNLSDNDEVFTDLKKAGLDVRYVKMPGIAHNKVMIIDKHKVITGSFNFTVGADRRNSENVVLIDDASIAALYLDNWRSNAKFRM